MGISWMSTVVILGQDCNQNISTVDAEPVKSKVSSDLAPSTTTFFNAGQLERLILDKLAWSLENLSSNVVKFSSPLTLRLDHKPLAGESDTLVSFLLFDSVIPFSSSQFELTTSTSKLGKRSIYIKLFTLPPKPVE